MRERLSFYPTFLKTILTFTQTICTLFFKDLFIDLLNTFFTFTMTCRYLLPNLIPYWSAWRMLKGFFNILSDWLFNFSWGWNKWLSNRLTNRFLDCIWVSCWRLSNDWLSDYRFFYNWFVSSRKFLKGFIAIVIKLFIYFFLNLWIFRLFFSFLFLLRPDFFSYYWCGAPHHLL